MVDKHLKSQPGLWHVYKIEQILDILIFGSLQKEEEQSSFEMGFNDRAQCLCYAAGDMRGLNIYVHIVYSVWIF